MDAELAEPWKPLPKQQQALDDITSEIIIFRGGYRSGKTVLEVCKAIDLGIRNWPHPLLFVAPSFHQVREVFVKEAILLCEQWGFEAHWYVSRKTLVIDTEELSIEIICRSADHPRSIEGLTVAAVVVDEWELCDIEAIIVAMARRSLPCSVPQIVLGGTPEGFGPGYQLLEKDLRPGTSVIVSRTAENTHIDKKYVERTKGSLSNEGILEKLEGERTAPSARVFTRFDRKLHHACCIEHQEQARLEVWANFHDSMMGWAFVLVDDFNKPRGFKRFHVVGELVTEHTDSQRQAAAAVKWIERWQSNHGRRIDARGTIVVCDARANNTTGVSPATHVTNVRAAGFRPQFARANPDDDDAVAAVQKVLGGRIDERTFATVRLTFEERTEYFVRCISNLQKAKGGGISEDERVGLHHGARVIMNGIMWRDPGTAVRTAFEENERAARWERLQREGEGFDDNWPR